MTAITYQTANVDGFNIFYREAGAPSAPKLLLLHGFPTSSHMFRDLIPLLAGRFHIVAPDLPDLAGRICGARHIRLYVRPYCRNHRSLHRNRRFRSLRRLYFRLRRAHRTSPRGETSRPDHGNHLAKRNAYEEGLSEGWNPIQAYWRDASVANREALRAFLKPEATVWQYTHGVSDTTKVSPGRLYARQFLSRAAWRRRTTTRSHGRLQKQRRALPHLSGYFRTHKPPLLAVWGKNDPFFLPPGAEAFKRDIPEAIVRFVDTGHFALETHAAKIATAIRDFLTSTATR